MASLIPGYEYDIFISYRQKDNKGDQWVSEFVEALKTELDSIFKDEISVYFDINTYDGLLETQDVEASLKEKLNCLIFIPILSRTYCDPRSFAWEHEFKTFVDLASKDEIGLKVKLPNGNIMNRILPIRIHDLDAPDIQLFESISGGILRGIEFIYKEPGVNKPLTSDDDENRNLNGTRYKIQVNKAANAIRELIHGISEESVLPVNMKKHESPLIQNSELKKSESAAEKSGRQLRILISTGIFIFLALLASTILFRPKISNKNSLDRLKSSGKRIAIAIMPFQNMTSDTSWNVWQDGIQNELINNLSNSGELVVKQVESLNNLIQSKGLSSYASMTPAIAGNISQKLNAGIFIYGSIKKAGEIIRLSAQVIDAATQESLKSFQINGSPENILKMSDSLGIMVNNFLILSRLIKELPSFDKTNVFTSSPEALRYFIYGQNYFFKEDFRSSQDWLLRAVTADTNFTQAMILLSISFSNEYLFEQTVTTVRNELLLDQAKKWCLMAYRKKDQLPVQQQINVNRVYAMCFETPEKVIECLNQQIDLDDQNPKIYFSLAGCYFDLYQYDKAIQEYEKALELYRKWGIKPQWSFDYTFLGESYHKIGRYNEEEVLLKKAEQEFPDDPYITADMAVLMITKNDTASANKYIKKGILFMKSIGLSDASIATVIAYGYSEAGWKDEAEKYYRKAANLEPDNPAILNELAYFLINHDRKIDEGLELTGKALELKPDYYEFLHTKGWGLFKKRQFKEAAAILQKSWDLRMKKAIYSHDGFLHLEAAKKALAKLN
jgi:tetratricopeptide (TPR) repeat protein